MNQELNLIQLIALESFMSKEMVIGQVTMERNCMYILCSLVIYFCLFLILSIKNALLSENLQENMASLYQSEGAEKSSLAIYRQVMGPPKKCRVMGWGGIIIIVIESFITKKKCNFRLVILG